MPDWDAALDGLAGLPDVTGAAIVSRDGLPVAVRLPAGSFPDSLCAMAAAGFAACEAATQDTVGTVARLDVAAARGRLLVWGADADVLFVVLASGAADADALHDAMDRLLSVAPAR